MSITVILHEASRTGAPRVGGIIAAALNQYEDVDLVVLKGGPLVPWLTSQVGPGRIEVCDDDRFSFRLPFDQRIDSAVKVLEERDSDLVYVNSVAASEFVAAAKILKRSVVLHAHEKAAELQNLLRHDLTKKEILLMTDAVVLAADTLATDLLEVFGSLPPYVVNFGTVVGIEEIAALASKRVPAPRNAAGEPIRWGERLVVGMCGHASPRKGSDIFLEVASLVPQFDFLWVGGWDPEEAVENTAFEPYQTLSLPNFYTTGSVENPFAYLGKMGLFFLSSREDPNPLVLAESLVLRVPILAFSGTTAVTEWAGRNSIMCYGPPNVTDAVRILNAIEPVSFRSDAFRGLYDESISRFDIATKLDSLLETFALIRGERFDAPGNNLQESV